MFAVEVDIRQKHSITRQVDCSLGVAGITLSLQITLRGWDEEVAGNAAYTNTFEATIFIVDKPNLRVLGTAAIKRHKYCLQTIETDTFCVTIQRVNAVSFPHTSDTL